MTKIFFLLFPGRVLMPEASGFGLLRMELTYQAQYGRLDIERSTLT